MFFGGWWLPVKVATSLHSKPNARVWGNSKGILYGKEICRYTDTDDLPI